jgi:hypothetical protein
MALDIPEYIRRKVVARLLPAAHSGDTRVWMGFGDGHACNACDRTISRGDVECEAEDPAGLRLRFHSACFHVWRRVRARE